jgi:flagellar biosynthesis chaperone FliJ
MSTREARIEKIVHLRDQRLKLAVRALEEVRLVERRVQAELDAASTARQGAERERRELSHTGTDIRHFIEAEEWLRARAIEEELCALRLRQVHAQLDKGQQRVKEAAIKLRQLERLQERLRLTRLIKENRAERVSDDEIGQRAAQSGRARKGET